MRGGSGKMEVIRRDGGGGGEAVSRAQLGLSRILSKLFHINGML